MNELQEHNDALNEDLSNRQANYQGLQSSNEEQRSALLEEIAALKVQVTALEEANSSLSARLDTPEVYEEDDPESLSQEVTLLHNQIATLKAELASQVAQSESNTKMHKNELLEKESQLQGKLEQAHQNHQADLDYWRSRLMEAEQDRDNDKSTIASLQAAINEKEQLLENKLEQALKDQDKLHQSDLGNWKSKVIELKESNAALTRELSELSTAPEDHSECNEKLASIQKDLQNALNDREQRKIEHNLALASVNAEFHNAVMSLDEMKNENKKLKCDIEELASKVSDEDRNFDEEMNAAHARFESMEKALQDRVSRLEKEKDKLLADFNEEMIKKEDEHTHTKVELSAWKLEMQNALNDIESLKKERDELKAQVQNYVKTIESMCTGKANTGKANMGKMHSL